MTRCCILIVLTTFLTACRTTAPSTVIGETAKEQVEIAYNNLPKECKSPEREREFRLAIKQIDAVVQSCEAEKVPLNQRIRFQSLALVALSILSIALFLGLIRSHVV